jgi:hypothetical protein
MRLAAWLMMSLGLALALAACSSVTPFGEATQTDQPTRMPNTPPPSLTPSPTNTIIPFTPTVNPTITTTPDSDCFQAEFMDDVTVVDGAPMRPGEIFLKIWQLENTGQCAWEGILLLAFEKGGRMLNPDAIPASLYSPGSELSLGLGERAWVERRVYRIEPGQTVDLAVVLQAPLTPGLQRAYFQLLDPLGNRMDQLYVVINVRDDTSPGAWSGQWGQRMPSFLEGEGSQLFLDQSGRDLFGFFYLQDGRLLLLTGRISEDGAAATGLWGEPWTAGSQFDWNLIAPDFFRGTFLSSSMPEGVWCGIRDGEFDPSLGDCLFEQP